MIPYSGPHFQSNHVNDWPRAVAQMPAGTWVKAIDNVQLLSEAKGRNPGIKTVLRHFDGGWQQFDFPDHAARRLHARRFLESFVDGTFMEHAANVNAIEEFNEYNATSHSTADKQKRELWVQAVCEEWSDFRMREQRVAHIRLVVGNVAIGNDITVTAARHAMNHDAIVGYHPYVPFRHPSRMQSLARLLMEPWQWAGPRPTYTAERASMRDGQAYALTIAREPDTPMLALSPLANAKQTVANVQGVMENEWPYLSGRFATMDAAFRAQGVTVDWLGTEGGPIGYYDWGGLDPMGGWKHADVCAGDINLYLQVIDYWTRMALDWNARNDGRMLGQVLYNSGGTSEWRHFETQTPELERIAVLMQSYEAPDPDPEPAPPPPPDNIPLPAEIVDYVDELPMNTDSQHWPYRTRPLSDITHIVLHHSAGLPTTPPESIAIGHINRNGGGEDGWPGIGYHFYIDGAGQIFKVNHLTTRSFHVGDDNGSTIGVCLAGHFGEVHPSPAQLAAARFLLRWLSAVVPGAQLAKHLDYVSTRCPGDTWPEWWAQLTEEPEPEERRYHRVAHLLPQDARFDELEGVLRAAFAQKQTVLFSADDAFIRAPELLSRTIHVWEVERVAGSERALRDWVAAHYGPWPTVQLRRFSELFVADKWSSPVGNQAQRDGTQLWPEGWVDANPYLSYYDLGYHTGADLNNNSVVFDYDRNMPVYAAASGRVTYAGIPSNAWQRVVVIEHTAPDASVSYSRYGHLGDIVIQDDQWVRRGQMIGIVGRNMTTAGPGPFHLHFDVSPTRVLLDRPQDWPGGDRARVVRDYVEPKAWIAARR